MRWLLIAANLKTPNRASRRRALRTASLPVHVRLRLRVRTAGSMNERVCISGVRIHYVMN